MKAATRKIGLFTAITALALCLAGCSSPSSGYVSINGEDLDLSELPKLIEKNQLEIKDEYIGKEMTVVAPFISIEDAENSTLNSAGDTQIMLDRPLGEVVIGTDGGRYIIQITEENREIAASLKAGATVKATGVFSAYDSTTGAVYLLTFDGFNAPDSIQPSIEIAEDHQ